MSRPTLRSLEMIAVLLIGIAVLPTAVIAGGGVLEPPGGQGPQVDGSLIWANSSRDSVVFIPAALLGSGVLEELPIPSRDRGAIRGVLAWSKPGGAVRCETIAERPVQGSAKETFGLVETVSQAEASFVGTVVDLETGWSPWVRRVAKLATVRVDEVLHERTEAIPEPGGKVAILFQGGQVEVEGRTLCDLPVPGLYRPAVGDRIVAAGGAWPDSRFFPAATVFPIQDGLVQPQPYSSLDVHEVPRVAEYLRDEIRSELREAEKGP